MREVSTRVLPLPAPASTSTAPSVSVTGLICSSLSFARISSIIVNFSAASRKSPLALPSPFVCLPLYHITPAHGKPFVRPQRAFCKRRIMRAPFLPRHVPRRRSALVTQPPCPRAPFPFSSPRRLVLRASFCSCPPFSGGPRTRDSLAVALERLQVPLGEGEGVALLLLVGECVVTRRGRSGGRSRRRPPPP